MGRWIAEGGMLSSVCCSQRFAGCARSCSRAPAGCRLPRNAWRRLDRARHPREVRRRAVRAIVISNLNGSTHWVRGLRTGWRKWHDGKGETLGTGVVVPVPLHRRGSAKADTTRPTGSPDRLPNGWGSSRTAGCCRCGSSSRPGQVDIQPYRALGNRPWRFCHAAGQPG
jgi:hypothetical protein